jgi:hypothetical protein
MLDAGISTDYCTPTFWSSMDQVTNWQEVAGHSMCSSIRHGSQLIREEKCRQMRAGRRICDMTGELLSNGETMYKLVQSVLFKMWEDNVLGFHMTHFCPPLGHYNMLYSIWILLFPLFPHCSGMNQCGVGYDFCNTCQFWVFKKIQNQRTPRVLGIWKFSGSKNSRFWVFEIFQNQRTIGFHERAGRVPTTLGGHLIFLIITVINFDTQLDTQWRFDAISNTHPTSGMNHEP